VDPAAYQALYRELLNACRSLADSAEGPARVGYERLEGFVRPWLNLRALERADRDILESLLDAARRTWRDLGGRDRAPTDFGPVARALASVVALAVLIALAWTAGGDSVLGPLRDRAETLWLAVRPNSDHLGIATAAAVVLASIYLVSRTARD
jgi:hypothetical protein